MVRTSFNDMNGKRICSYDSSSSYDETRDKLDEALRGNRITSMRHIAYIEILNKINKELNREENLDNSLELIIDSMMDGKAGDRLWAAMNIKPKDAEYHEETRVLDKKEIHAYLGRAIKELDRQKATIQESAENARKAA